MTQAKAYMHPFPWGLEYAFHYRLVAEAILDGIQVEDSVIKSFGDSKLELLKPQVIKEVVDHAWNCQAVLHGKPYPCSCGI
jgi:hypothetical protein